MMSPIPATPSITGSRPKGCQVVSRMDFTHYHKAVLTKAGIKLFIE